MLAQHDFISGSDEGNKAEIQTTQTRNYGTVTMSLSEQWSAVSDKQAGTLGLFLRWIAVGARWPSLAARMVRSPSRVAGVLAAVALGLAACTPTFDWREQASADNSFRVTFPGRVAVASRDVPLGATPVPLTLQSARIDDAMFAVGIAQVPAGRSAAEVAQQLRQAMLVNIGLAPDAVPPRPVQWKRKSSGTVDGLEISARGTLQGKTEALLVMRTTELDGKVIEVIAVGPASQLPEAEARLFVESLQWP